MKRYKPDALPIVGLHCRDYKRHNFDRVGEEGYDDYPGSFYYRLMECTHDCGTRRILRYNKYGKYLPEISRILYEDPDYLVKGGVDEDQMGLWRLRQWGVTGSSPEKAAPKRRGTGKSKSGHLKSVS